MSSDRIRPHPMARTRTPAFNEPSCHTQETGSGGVSEDYERDIDFVGSKSELAERSRTTTTSTDRGIFPTQQLTEVSNLDSVEYEYTKLF